MPSFFCLVVGVYMCGWVVVVLWNCHYAIAYWPVATEVIGDRASCGSRLDSQKNLEPTSYSPLFLLDYQRIRLDFVVVVKEKKKVVSTRARVLDVSPSAFWSSTFQKRKRNDVKVDNVVRHLDLIRRRLIFNLSIVIGSDPIRVLVFATSVNQPLQ